MNDTSSTSDPIRSPIYRYGMLVPILGLLAVTVWRFVRVSDQGRFSGDTGLVVVSMLLVNHLVGSFLPPERQRAVRVPHFLFVAVAFLYVVVTAVLEWP